MFKPLGLNVPIYGPLCQPPTYRDEQKRSSSVSIKPQTLYIKPLYVVHPFYFPELAKCPQCGTHETTWEGWTTSGPRNVHGLWSDALAIGYQLRCTRCEKQSEIGEDGKRTLQYCWSTTSREYWIKYQHYEIPGKYTIHDCQRPVIQDSELSDDVPHFFRRCAVTRDTFNFIIEVRLKGTAAGLAENIKREPSDIS